MRIAILGSLLGISVWAQSAPPPVTNARLENRAVTGSLDASLRAAQAPTWFGYTVPTFPRDNDQGCCYEDGGRSGCSLEESGRRSARLVGSKQPIPLEAGALFTVLLRVSEGKVEKVRGYPATCPLDAGGLPFVWLTNVTAQESLRYLNTLVQAKATRVGRDAIFVISQHADPQATTMLVGFTAPTQPFEIREQAIFWLGASRADVAVPILARLVTDDANEQIRDKAVFALSMDHDPGALKALIDAAHHNDSPHIRGQALFWLAQRAGQQSASAISDAIANDPDTEVKKRAVFALSQLPKDEAVRELIRVARSQRNPEVRKQAFFWLGQTNDPRALQFLEEVLKN